VRRRHPDVDDRKIRIQSAHEREEPIRVTGLTYDLKTGALKQARDTFAHEEVIVGDDNARAGRIFALLHTRHKPSIPHDHAEGSPARL
jgi:hypothetical protein